MKKNIAIVLVALFSIALSKETYAKWPKGIRPFARTSLMPKSGSEVSGTVDFAKGKKGLMIRAYLDHVPPGRHGFHIHENGNCDGNDASGAGEHFNPTGEIHAGPIASHRHEGDFGNLTAAKDGKVTEELVILNPKSKEFSGWDNIVGRTLVLHANIDDLKTQPSGNSGARIACGVITSTTTLGE